MLESVVKVQTSTDMATKNTSVKLLQPLQIPQIPMVLKAFVLIKVQKVTVQLKQNKPQLIMARPKRRRMGWYSLRAGESQKLRDLVAIKFGLAILLVSAVY